MKIIEPGIDRGTKPVRFKCNACGCVFEAEPREYSYVYPAPSVPGYYIVKCPHCSITARYIDLGEGFNIVDWISIKINQLRLRRKR